MEATTVRNATSPKLMIEKLRDEAKKNKCLNAICHVFALRERARGQVTLGALKQTMAKEGFDFKNSEYEDVLIFFGKIGLGTVSKNSKGRVDALKNIKYTLQTIGRAAVSEEHVPTKKFAPRNKYIDAPIVPPVAPPAELTNFERPVPQDAIKVQPGRLVENVALTASINGMPVVFVIADSLETSQLGRLLVKLSDKALLLDM